ncbi:MAG: hypothetical protein JW940_18850 [Polyangiaceae bacterium]|nr:hypothetical protein [Polyangiaceae bacterium]
MRRDPEIYDLPRQDETVACSCAQVAARPRRLGAAAEALAWTIASLPLGWLLLRADRPSGPVWTIVFDAAHVVLSAGLASVLLRLSPRLLSGVFSRAGMHHVVAGGTVLVVGGGLEIAQFFVPGEPSLPDLARDALGAAAALVLSHSRHVEPTRAWGRRRLRAWALRALGASLLCLGLAPSFGAARAILLRHRAFPVLLTFESAWETRFASTTGNATLEFVPPPRDFTRAQGHGVGKVVFAGSKYPALELDEPFGDWSAFDALVFDVYSPEPGPIGLGIRVHDRGHGHAYDDRFNAEADIRPGQNTISIPVAAIRATSGRSMRLDRIQAAIVFLYRPRRATTLYFDSFRLDAAVVGADRPTDHR